MLQPATITRKMKAKKLCFTWVMAARAGMISCSGKRKRRNKSTWALSAAHRQLAPICPTEGHAPPFPTHFMNRTASVPCAVQHGGPGQADTGSKTFLMVKEGMVMEGNGAEWLNWEAGSARAAPSVCEEGIWT